MSGGVDSSVTAALMQREGYECTGVTLRLSCASNEADIEDARRVCAALGMPHQILDAQEEFSEHVIDPFVRGYLAGSTPNPCIDCNRSLKFGVLLAWAQQEGFDCLATGHYARTEGGRLCKAKDASKDQSYVLYMLNQEQLSFIHLPLGNYTKEEVRSLAAGWGFETAHKQESQDICFVPSGDYAGFIETEALQRGLKLPVSGSIVTSNGEVVGTHEGVHRFTIGQRRGLGVPGPEPLYVLDIKPETAVVLVGTEQEQGRCVAYLNNVNSIDPALLCDGKDVLARHRYRGREHEARVFMQEDNTAKIVFLHSQRDITRGQALVYYDGDCVLGGGTIVATG